MIEYFLIGAMIIFQIADILTLAAAAADIDITAVFTRFFLQSPSSGRLKDISQQSLWKI